MEGDIEEEAEDKNQDVATDGEVGGGRTAESIILPRGCECGCGTAVSPELSDGALPKAFAVTGGLDLAHSSLQCPEARSVQEAVEDRPRIAGGGLRDPWAIRRERNEQQQELVLHDARIITRWGGWGGGGGGWRRKRLLPIAEGCENYCDSSSSSSSQGVLWEGRSVQRREVCGVGEGGAGGFWGGGGRGGRCENQFVRECLLCQGMPWKTEI